MHAHLSSPTWFHIAAEHQNSSEVLSERDESNKTRIIRDASIGIIMTRLSYQTCLSRQVQEQPGFLRFLVYIRDKDLMSNSTESGRFSAIGSDIA